MEVSRGSTRINHLLFVDDCVLFEKASNMQDILSIYEKGSSQVLNEEKSSIFFSQNTKTRDKELVIQAIRSTICSSYEKYLGLSTMVRRPIGALRKNFGRELRFGRIHFYLKLVGRFSTKQFSKT